MSRYIALTLSNTTRRGVRKSSIRKNIKIGPVTLSFIAIVLVCFFSLFYLVVINDLAIKGYEAEALEKRIEELKDSNKKLETQANELKSINKIEESVRKLNMVEIKEVSYITSTSEVAVAER